MNILFVCSKQFLEQQYANIQILQIADNNIKHFIY